jgi:hypothetical protein
MDIEGYPGCVVQRLITDIRRAGKCFSMPPSESYIFRADRVELDNESVHVFTLLIGLGDTAAHFDRIGQEGYHLLPETCPRFDVVGKIVDGKG